MYPNPQDAVPLPPHPDLEQYRKRAKELVKASRAGEDAIRAWATEWVSTLLSLYPDLPDFTRRDAGRRAHQVTDFARERLGRDGTLSQAQFVLARAHGFASWPKLVHHIEAVTAADPRRSAYERAGGRTHRDGSRYHERDRPGWHDGGDGSRRHARHAA